MKSTTSNRLFWSVLAGLLTLLGFANTSCTGADEYGSPETTYRALGTVVDKDTGNPLAGVDVLMFNHTSYESGQDGHPRGKDKTDPSGKFDVTGWSFGDRMVLLVDGNNYAGDYENFEVTFNYRDPEWYTKKNTYDFGTIRIAKINDTTD